MVSTWEQARGSLSYQPGPLGSAHVSRGGFSRHVPLGKPLLPSARPTGAAGRASTPCTSEYLRAAGDFPGFTSSLPSSISYFPLRCSSALHADFGLSQSWSQDYNFLAIKLLIMVDLASLCDYECCKWAYEYRLHDFLLLCGNNMYFKTLVFKYICNSEKEKRMPLWWFIFQSCCYEVLI